MSAGVGQNAFLEVVKESVYGTDPGSGYQALRMNNSTFLGTGDDSRGNRGLGKVAPSGIVQLNKREVGDIGFDMLYEGHGALLLAAFGDETFTADTPEAGVGRHILDYSTTMPSMTVRQNEDVQRIDTTGVQVPQVRVNISNEILEMIFSLRGKIHAQDTVTPSPTYPTAPDVLAVDTGAGLTIEVDDVAVSCARSMFFQGVKPIDESANCLGSGTIREASPSGFLEVTGELTLEYEAATYDTKWLADTYGKMEATYISSTNIPTTSTPYQFKFVAYECLFGTSRGPIEGPGTIIERIPFRAMVDSSGLFFRMTIENAENAAF